MILLSWNCRGLARASAKRALQALIKDIGPDIIFLSETKVPIDRIKKFLNSLNFYFLDFVNPRGKKGGLVVGWKIGVDLEITSKGVNMINGLIFSDPVNEPWFVSFVYGPPSRNDRGPFGKQWRKWEMPLVEDGFVWVISTMSFPKQIKKVVDRLLGHLVAVLML